MNSKHIPVRKCIVCGEKFPKKDLVKVVMKNDEFALDVNQKSEGRGAYICNNPDCHDKFLKKRCLDRAFKRHVDISVYEQILEEINRN